ncbi:MAG: hypothetical protein OXF88_02945 [Rhodobacteraceae bacterium]|nr:hypothetical protein [Paracoccaceae bacterium]
MARNATPRENTQSENQSISDLAEQAVGLTIGICSCLDEIDALTGFLSAIITCGYNPNEYETAAILKAISRAAQSTNDDKAALHEKLHQIKTALD